MSAEIDQVQIKKQKQQKLLIAACSLAVLSLMIGLFQLNQPAPKITDPTYYTGPMMNHNGDLVDANGKIVEHAKKSLRSLRQRRE